MESQPLQTLRILRCVKVNLKDFKFDDQTYFRFARNM